MQLKACFFILYCLFTFKATAQQLPLETYTPANGLVDERVTKMFQDSKGRIYFLTREGFSIFDGQRFDNYANTGENTGIINDIAEYSDGTVKLYSFDGDVFVVKGSKVTKDTSQSKLLTEFTHIFTLHNGDKIISTNKKVFRESNSKLIELSLPFASYHEISVTNCIPNENLLLLAAINKRGQNLIYLYNYQTQKITDSVLNFIFYESNYSPDGSLFIKSNKWFLCEDENLKKGKFAIMEAPFNSILPYSHKTSLLCFDRESDLFFLNQQGAIFKIDHNYKRGSTFATQEKLLPKPVLYFKMQKKIIGLHLMVMEYKNYSKLSFLKL